MRLSTNLAPFFLFVCISSAFSQEDPARKNISKKDTAGFYKDLKDYAKDKKFFHEIHKAIFVDPSRKRKNKKIVENNYKKYQGRIIRDIQITTYDPFGYNVRDTSVKARSPIQHGGNFLHQKSTRLTIRNQLMIHKGDSLDLLKLKESERIIRQSDYARDVVFIVVPVSGTKDSVDIIIREQDLWSKTFGLGIAATTSNFSFGEKNFLGLSHQLNTNFVHTYPSSYDIIGSYKVPYIRNTFITSTLYFNSMQENYMRGISFHRPFYSPLTKWAGGADFLKLKASSSVVGSDFNPINYSVRYDDIDLWAGRSFQLVKDTSDQARTTRFIVSARYQKLNYLNPKLPAIIDSTGLHESRNFYLASFGVSHREYYQDHYIYRYGTPEDVPFGRMVQALIGYETRLSADRLYTGIRIIGGDRYDKFGYLSAMIGFGTFLRDNKMEQSVFNTNIFYFSDLIPIGKWRLRQFIKTQLVCGLNRFPSETINIDNENGLRGFESPLVKGTKKLVLNLQTQAYSPFSVIGFRFAPFVFVNLGLVGDESHSLINSRVYQAIGLGLLIKNEYLVVNSFQFTFAFYPSVPGTGSNIVKFDPVRTYDLQFNDFEFSKPLPVSFE